MYPLPSLPHGHSETTLQHQKQDADTETNADTVQISPVQPVLMCTCLRLVPHHFITLVGLSIYQLEVWNSSDSTGTLLPPCPSPSLVPGNCDPLLDFCRGPFTKWCIELLPLPVSVDQLFSQPEFPQGSMSQCCVSTAHPWCGCPIVHAAPTLTH